MRKNSPINENIRNGDIVIIRAKSYETKGLDEINAYLLSFDWTADDQLAADLLRLLTDMARDGIGLFGEGAALQVDWTLVNAAAADWARDYVGELITQINETTRKAVRGAIAAWIETPGMTLGDTLKLIAPYFAPSRSMMIAVTEVTRAYATAAQLAGEQMKRDFPDVPVVKIWFTNSDEMSPDKPCAICRPLNGTEVEIDESFETEVKGANGKTRTVESFMPPAHVRCILPENLLAIPDLVAAAKSFYVGGAVEFRMHSGRVITVTKNHPILTPHGWVRAELVTESDYFFGATNPQRIAQTINPNYNYMPTDAEQVFSSFEKSNGVSTATVPSAPEHFHGDGRGLNGDVNVIYSNSLLTNSICPNCGKHIKKQVFGKRDIGFFGLPDNSDFSHNGFRYDNPLSSGMGGANLSSPLLFTHPSPFHNFGGAVTPDAYTVLNKPSAKSSAIDSGLAAKFVLRFSGDISLDKVSKIRNFDFSGHVYDFQASEFELYNCNGIITHNCRCWLDTRTRILGR